MASRPRVLLVGPWPPTIGGVTSFMLKLEASSVAAHVAFHRFTTSRPPKRNTIDNWGYRAVLQGGFGRLLRGAGLTAWHMAIFPFYAARAEIVQVQASDFFTFWESLYYVLVAKALGCRVIMRLGGAFDFFYGTSPITVQRAIRAALRRPHRLIVQSGYWQQVVAGLGRSDGVSVVPNWVPDALAQPGARPARPPVVLFIAGSEGRRKGLDTVLAAIDATPEVQWRVVAAPDLPLRKNLVISGKLAHPEMLDAMRAADIFVLPSRGEGFPNSLVEAMALGLACIATPVGAVPEILNDAGLLMPVDDADALARHVRTLANDAVLRGELGEAGRQVVLARYTETRVAATLRALYAPEKAAS